MVEEIGLAKTVAPHLRLVVEGYPHNLGIIGVCVLAFNFFLFLFLFNVVSELLILLWQFCTFSSEETSDNEW